VKTMLIADASPVRTRLAAMLSELPNIQLEMEGPFVDADLIMTKFNPDVVLIDIDLTQGHGLEIIRKFHQALSGGTPVIVAIANSRSLRYRASCLEAGAIYYFNAVREQEWLLDSLASIREQLGE
jgi:chemotaxis response regulator CheB